MLKWVEGDPCYLCYLLGCGVCAGAGPLPPQAVVQPQAPRLQVLKQVVFKCHSYRKLRFFQVLHVIPCCESAPFLAATTLGLPILAAPAILLLIY